MLLCVSASVPGTSFEAYHTKIHDMIKHQLAPAKLGALFSDLNVKFSKHLISTWGETGTGTNNVLNTQADKT